MRKGNRSQRIKCQLPRARVIGKHFGLFYHALLKPVQPHVGFFILCRTCEGQNIKYRTCSNVVSSANSSLCNGCQLSFQVGFNCKKTGKNGIEHRNTQNITELSARAVIWDPVEEEKTRSCFCLIW